MKIFGLTVLLLARIAGAQTFIASVSTTATQAVLQYSSPVAQACSLKAADMNRNIRIADGVQSAGLVTITTRSPHGFSAGAVIYIEGTAVTGWDGWQTVSTVTDATHFQFSSGVAGTTAQGNVGVLVDDLNPNLFPEADRDSRKGNPGNGPRASGAGQDLQQNMPANGRQRTFVVGARTAEIAADGNRYTRALQVNSRHRYTLTCGTQSLDREFTTQNLPLGDTHNDGPTVDRSHPGQYGYPTVQWTNRNQSLIDPATGVRSMRATGPTGKASTLQTFQSAIDTDRVWRTPRGPLSPGGTAAFTGPCQGISCALFLRADSLSLPGGATYNSLSGEGSSLDWVTLSISNASVSNAACASGSSSDDCKIAVCLTVDGVACASAERSVSLTSAPATYSVGAQQQMDLWQGSGAPGIARPDVSVASGAVNYASATRLVTWVSGRKFSIKWKAGSRISVAGSEYAIEAVQSELTLKLADPGPVGDLHEVPYTANNFGVLIRKKTSSTDQVTIGYTTFQYGSSGVPGWPAAAETSCSPSIVTVQGAPGYNCFSSTELYWVSTDGTDVRDLGGIGLPDSYGLLWSTGYPCGQTGNQFDPLDGDTWYCLIPYKPFTDPRQAIIKAHYEGRHTAYAPGAILPGCDQNGGVQPCVRYTPMQPDKSDSVDVAGPAFNPEYAASGYVASIYIWGGISLDGDLMILTREAGGQDTKGWQFIFTLGDRTPAGTGPNSFRPIASAASYMHAPLSWCVVHSNPPPKAGWLEVTYNDFSLRGAGAVYGMTLTSAALTSTVGGTGGLKACPANSLGVTGQTCTDITVSGEPRLAADGSYFRNTQVGDLIRIDSEYMRIVAKTDSNHLTVQRGYLNSLASHPGVALAMSCGARSLWGINLGLWNYRADPFGLNAGGSTVLVDMYSAGGHSGSGPGVQVNATANHYNVGESMCPAALLSSWAQCYQIRRGSTPAEISMAPTMTIAENPPFAGGLGVGNPNMVDSHPGPCLSQWCLDARPVVGGTGDGAASMAGSPSNPWINVTGQLWKIAKGTANLRPKTLPTMAYVGRFPLVDVSGPASAIATDAGGAYQYCVALKASECRSGSAAGDIYVNAPYVSTPYCNYPGIAIQGDDTNSICVGPLGAYAANTVQFGTTRQSVAGAAVRRLGSTFARWNQQNVFWNMSMTPGGELGFSQVRWLDGARHENLVTVLPPFPDSDSVARNTFVPVPMSIPPGRAGGNAVVEFGYAENGGVDSFYCTSRQEACVAATTAVSQTSPFYFAQSESYTGAPCTAGCTVTVPALSQRVLYYRWKQRDASGNVIAVSETRAVVTP